VSDTEGYVSRVKDDLSKRDESVILAALRAALDGPFFPEWEFQTLMGISRDEMRAVLAAWPDRSSQTAFLAVNNALNNIWGYPHEHLEAWVRVSDAPRDEVREVLDRWKGGRADGLDA
jgi:hypothetical protein